MESSKDLGEPVSKGEIVARIHPVGRTGAAPAEHRAAIDGLLAGAPFPRPHQGRRLPRRDRDRREPPEDPVRSGSETGFNRDLLNVQTGESGHEESVLPALSSSRCGRRCRATSLEDVKSNGYIRGASANEVPYSYMDENGTAKGIGPDVAVAVLKSMGVNEIDWTVTPFGSLIPGLKARRFDFVAAEMNILPDRCKQVAFTEPNSSYGEGLLVPRRQSQEAAFL